MLEVGDLARRNLANAGSVFFLVRWAPAKKSRVLNFREKFLKLFPSDLERTSKDTTLNPKKYSSYEQEIPSWRSLIHHHIRAYQSGLSDPRKGADEHVLR